jgi:hypothetical protein
MKVLRHIPTPTAPADVSIISLPPAPETPESSSIDTQLFETSLLNSSPGDAAALRRTNTALATLIDANALLFTPARKYIRQLASKAEQL